MCVEALAAVPRIEREYRMPLRARSVLLASHDTAGSRAAERAALDAWHKDLAPTPALREWFDHRDDRFEAFRGRLSLRYATARRMEANCLGCHNKDPASTKQDWKEGDVGGVLEIVRPLDRDIERTRRGLRGTFLLMGGVSGTLLMLSALVLVVRGRRLK